MCLRKTQKRCKEHLQTSRTSPFLGRFWPTAPLLTSTSVRLSIQFLHGNTPSAQLAVWACIDPHGTMQHPVLLGRDSWMRFEQRTYTTTPSGGWIRRQCRREIERRRAGQGRVELTLRENFYFQTSTETARSILFFGTGEKGNRLEGSGNQSTFEGVVTECAKTLRLPRTAAAGRYTKTRDRRAHDHESSCHRIFLWIFDEAVPF